MANCNPGTRQYIGARYVPRHMGEWSADTQYSALDVVLYTDGNSYTAKCYPPIGTIPTDNKYWSLSAQFNQQLADVNGKLVNIEYSLKEVEPEKINIVENNEFFTYNGVVYKRDDYAESFDFEYQGAKFIIISNFFELEYIYKLFPDSVATVCNNLFKKKNILYVYPGEYTFGGNLEITANNSIIGTNKKTCKVIFNGDDYAIKLKYAPVSTNTDVQTSGKIENITIYAKNGIYCGCDYTDNVTITLGYSVESVNMYGKYDTLNDPYIDTAQPVVINTLKPYGVGIEFSVCFEMSVKKCHIENFGCGVFLTACDLCRFEQVRTILNGIGYYFKRMASYGSQCVIDNCTIATNRRAGNIINDGYFFLTVCNSYFECYRESYLQIICNADFGTIMYGNRFDSPNIDGAILGEFNGTSLIFSDNIQNYNTYNGTFKIGKRKVKYAGPGTLNIRNNQNCNFNNVAPNNSDDLEFSCKNVYKYIDFGGDIINEYYNDDGSVNIGNSVLNFKNIDFKNAVVIVQINGGNQYVKVTGANEVAGTYDFTDTAQAFKVKCDGNVRVEFSSSENKLTYIKIIPDYKTNE